MSATTRFNGIYSQFSQEKISFSQPLHAVVTRSGVAASLAAPGFQSFCRPSSYASQYSITAKMFLLWLLAVQKSKCVLYMLMREEWHCGRYISNGLITFCKVGLRHAIEAQRTNNISFRGIGVKRYPRVRKIPLNERLQDWASDSHKEQILLFNLSPLFCFVLQNGFLILWKHCHNFDLCLSSRTNHLNEAYWK